jgi:hypothetical protein
MLLKGGLTRQWTRSEEGSIKLNLEKQLLRRMFSSLRTELMLSKISTMSSRRI